MAVNISDLYGNDITFYERLIGKIGFNFHVCLPCIVQKYNLDSNTIECQPTIRERVINEDNIITYQNYPLLVDVPVCFPQSSNASITFPINTGDECIVVFSDLAIDNWFVNGNIQNPVEQRRHDLSDAFAIFGIRNQNKVQPQYDNDSLIINYKNSVLKITDSDILFTIKGRKDYSLNVLIDEVEFLRNHVHTVGGQTTGRPE